MPAFVHPSPSLSRLVEELNKLPGIGPKSAQRLAYFLLRTPNEQARALAEAILQVKEKVLFCSRCFNIAEEDPCPFCSSNNRETTKICVVEEPLDVLAIERTGAYKGLYHVLHGALSPSDGIGPEDLKIKELLFRLHSGTVQEVILATNPNLEGESTAMYIQRLVSPLGIKITRLARGLPVGSDLEYADEVTLARALQGRQEF
ncbi:MAG: recombination protein RecR [Chloroflexi bacterium]|nr:recombination protein RecR [Chloroflexota bacterium]